MKTTRFLCTVLAVLLLTSLAPAQPAPPPPQQPPRPPDTVAAMELVRDGRRLANQGKHDEALALYRQALEKAPNLYDAHISTGIVLDLKGDYAEAQKHLTRAIEIAEQQKQQALRTMAMAQAFAGNGKKAAEYQKQVLDTRLAANDFAGAAVIANEGARLLLETGEIDDAEEWYRLGYETALRHPGLKDEERALWEFRWHHAQARLAARRGRHAEAQKHLAPAKAALDQANNPDQAPYYPYLVGYLAFYAGENDQAIAELQKSSQRDPFVLSLLAQAHEKKGEQAKAMEYYRKVLEFNLHNPTGAFSRPLAQKKAGSAPDPHAHH